MLLLGVESGEKQPDAKTAWWLAADFLPQNTANINGAWQRYCVATKLSALSAFKARSPGRIIRAGPTDLGRYILDAKGF